MWKGSGGGWQERINGSGGLDSKSNSATDWLCDVDHFQPLAFSSLNYKMRNVLEHALASTEEYVITHVGSPTPRVSAGLEGGLTIFISNNFPGDVGGVGPHFANLCTKSGFSASLLRKPHRASKVDQFPGPPAEVPIWLTGIAAHMSACFKSSAR